MPLESAAAAGIGARLSYMRTHRLKLVIDGDVHPTPLEALPTDIAERIKRDPNYYQGKPLLASHLLPVLDRAGVDMALCWQNPAVLRYVEEPAENFRWLLGANQAVAEIATKYPTRVIPAGWTDPKALGLDNALELVHLCVQRFGMPVIKMNPAQNNYPIDAAMVLDVVDRIVELGAVPAFHFGSDSPYTPPAGLEAVAERHPEHPVIGVHMGGSGGHFVEADPVYIGARELGLRRPNIFYVLSAIRDTHIESALLTYASAGAPYAQNIAVGSDAPYGNVDWSFGGFRALFRALQEGVKYGDPRLAERPELFSDAVVAGFMGRNIADLVIAADQRLLARQQPENTE